jgi:APA family basic amino acid/polyamine antiporter
VVDPEVPLRRVLSLPLLTLYGVGTIVGAGFYALLGEVAGLAGSAAPSAILLAAVVASFTALSFAELTTRYPVSGGPVRYVEAAFGSPLVGRVVGVAVIFTGLVSAATLARAIGGFLEQLHGWPPAAAIVLTVGGLSALACWGVGASGWFAAGIAVLEVGVLLCIPFLRFDALVELPARAGELLPGSDAPASGVLLGAFLVFYAFIGFEDMVTLAEEVHEPERNMPRAIIAAIAATAVLYLFVAAVAVLAVPPAELAADAAPVSLLVVDRAPLLRTPVVYVGVLAGLNGALIQLLMAARVLYGMRGRRGLSAWLGAVHPRRRTPVRATLLVGAAAVILALAFPLVVLASWTSAILLLVFAAVNAALCVLHAREPHVGFRVPRPVPYVGALLCLALLSVEFLPGSLLALAPH